MNKRVLGLDISRNFAVAFLLIEAPEQPFEWFNSQQKQTITHKRKTYTYNTHAVFLPNNLDGLNRFKALAPNVVILEPTGYWYSQYWVAAAQQMDCEILWMAHQSLAKHRAHYGFKNKNDDIDAFVLALTYFDEFLPKKWRYMTHYNDSLVQRLRLTFYERKRLLKTCNRNTNQLAQYLEVEWPEIATRDLTYLNKLGINPTLGHLAGITVNRQMTKINTGSGISPRTRQLVEFTIQVQEQILEQQQILKTIVGDRVFESYVKVFNNYNFGTALSAHLLLKIYPLERFLANGEVVDKSNRNLSLRQFQAYLGLSYHYAKSGDTSHQQNKVKKHWAGPSLTRSDLYAWLLSGACRVNLYRPKNRTQCKLRDLWTQPRTYQGKPLPSFQALGKDGICRMLFVVTRWLWNDLYSSIKELDF